MPRELLNAPEVADLLDRLRAVLARMDEAYGAVAAHYGFDCRGCRDNCCASLFYHHTYLEWLLLHQGLAATSDDVQRAVQTAARRAVAGPPATGRMCPANLRGRCQLYTHRPMICRLHGVPHTLTAAGRPPVEGPGCETFQRQCGTSPSRRLDRTLHYTRLALLEQTARARLGVRRPLRMTVAQMLCTDPVWRDGRITGPQGGSSCA